MRKFFPLLFILCLSFSSCLTITESYYFKKDGSGTMRFYVDFSEMETLLSYADREHEAQAMDDLSFVEVVKQLKQIDGIYEVTLLDEPEQYRWGVAYEFEHTVALNKALNILLINGQNQTFHPFIEYHGQLFKSNHMMNKFVMRDKLTEDERLAPLAEQVMKKMDYNIHYEFAQPIKVVYASQEVELVGSKPKKLDLSANFWELEDNKTILDATLVLK
ncbi:MAG: hypothetical protein AAFN10_07110 [Bacteroidota bacterium]